VIKQQIPGLLPIANNQDKMQGVLQMQKNKWAILALTVSSFLDSASAQTASDWKLQRDREGIQVYTRSVEGSPYDAVRAVTVIENVRLAAMVSLIEDAEACPEWADRCADSYVYKRLAENELLIYTLNDMPFPVKDRDVLARVMWNQDPATHLVTISSQATVGEMPEIEGRLRLIEANSQWYFRPLSSGAVEVSNEAHINPGSALPGWMTNILLVDTPYETMRAFIEAVQQDKYQQAKIPGIVEP